MSKQFSLRLEIKLLFIFLENNTHRCINTYDNNNIILKPSDKLNVLLTIFPIGCLVETCHLPMISIYFYSSLNLSS